MSKGNDHHVDKKLLAETLSMTQTRLSVERTFLSYIRTALTLIVAGTSLMQFFDYKVFRILGFIFILLGFFMGIYGGYRYRRNRKMLHKMDKKILDLVESLYED